MYGSLLILLCVLMSPFCAHSQNIQEDYSRLSQKSSKELMDEGRNYFEKRDGRKALSRFLLVGERYNSKGTREEIETSIRALNNAGCVYKYLYYEYLPAYEYLSKAYQLCQSEKFEGFLPIVMVNLGDLLNDYGTVYDSEEMARQALDLFDKCFKMALENKDWELLTTAFFNVSNLNYDVDLTKYKDIFRKEIPANTPDLEFIRLQYKGIESLQKKNFDEARNYFNKQMEVISTPWEPERDSISSRINIAQTFLLEKNLPKAAEAFEEALNVAEGAGIKDLSAKISNDLAQVYKELGDMDQYQLYRASYLEKMEDMHSSRLSNVAELKYLADLKNEEDQRRELAMHHRLQSYFMWGVVVILLIILLAVIVIWRKNRQLHATNRNLYENYRRLLDAESPQNDKKYSHSNLNDSRREDLVERIKEVFEQPVYICSQDFSSKELAKLVDSNTTYVSQIINENFGTTFSTLLGNYRVREACRRINEKGSNLNLTIEAIANSVGFKSRTAFLNAFKREVGLTPSEYLKMASTSAS